MKLRVVFIQLVYGIERTRPESAPPCGPPIQTMTTVHAPLLQQQQVQQFSIHHCEIFLFSRFIISSPDSVHDYLLISVYISLPCCLYLYLPLVYI